MEEKKEKRLANFYEREVKVESMKIPPMGHTFRSARFIHSDLARESKEKISMIVEAFEELMVGVIGEDSFEVEGSGLPSFPMGQELNN